MSAKYLICDVSVIVPHYGDPRHAARLVASLRGEYGTDLEVIVVDDCSPEPFPPSESARVMRRDENGGFGSAVNSGAALATRPFLLILNSDLELTPQFIERLLRASQPWQPAVTGPALLGTNGETQWSGRHFPRTRHYVTEWLRPLARWRGSRRLHEAVGHDTRCVPGMTTTTDWLVGAALLVPTAEFRAVGGFDERFYMYCEEADIQKRLGERGTPSVYLGEVTVTHEGGGSTDSERWLGWLLTSRFFYAHKWHKRPRLMRLGLIAATLVNVAFAVVRRLLGKGDLPIVTLRKEFTLINAAARSARLRSGSPAATVAEGG